VSKRLTDLTAGVHADSFQLQKVTTAWNTVLVQ
jgi:hypothetical protein